MRNQLKLKPYKISDLKQLRKDEWKPYQSDLKSKSSQNQNLTRVHTETERIGKIHEEYLESSLEKVPERKRLIL